MSKLNQIKYEKEANTCHMTDIEIRKAHQSKMILRCA